MEIVNSNDYLDQLDKEIEENSDWIKVPQDETKRLQFIIKEKLDFREEYFNNKPTGVWKTFYKAIDVNSINKRKRTFRAASKSSKLINLAYRISKDGILDITHRGTMNKTVYIPTVVHPKEGTEELQKKLSNEIAQATNSI